MAQCIYFEYKIVALGENEHIKQSSYIEKRVKIIKQRSTDLLQGVFNLDRERLAARISLIFNAPLMMFCTFIPLIMIYGQGNKWTLFFITSAFGCVLPMLSVFAFLKFGVISDFYASNKDERFFPFMTTIASYLIGLVLLIYNNSPGPVTALMASYIVNGLIMVFITLKWKISIHASGIASPIMALIFFLGSSLIPLVVLVLPVAWSRLELKAHSKWQLTMGALLSGILTWIQMVLYTNYIFLM